MKNYLLFLLVCSWYGHDLFIKQGRERYYRGCSRCHLWLKDREYE